MENHFILFNDALYRVPKNTRNIEISQYKLVIPAQSVQIVLRMLHSRESGIHLGVYKTFFSARRRFYWLKMYKDIKNYIANCTICLENKRSQHRQNPKMTMFDQCTAPFQVIQVDLLGPLAMTKNRNRYIAVCVDQFSRYLITLPLRRKTQEAFAQGFYDNVLSKYGLINQLHSDLGREFQNKILRAVCQKYKIKQTFTSGYCSQANGLAERQIQNM